MPVACLWATPFCWRCTALGAASLLRTYPALFMVVKYAGAAYLAWVGLNLLWAAIAEVAQPDAPAACECASTLQAPAHLQHPFKRALVISLLNPKAILFLLSFFVQFIDPTYDTARGAIPDPERHPDDLQRRCTCRC